MISSADFSALDFSSSAVSSAFSDEDEADVVACDEDDISVDVVSEGGCFDSASSVSMISSADFSSLVDGCCLSDVGDCCCAAEEDESEAGDFSIAEELDDAPSIAEDAGGGDDEGPDFTFASPESHGPLASSALSLSSDSVFFSGSCSSSSSFVGEADAAAAAAAVGFCFSPFDPFASGSSSSSSSASSASSLSRRFTPDRTL